MDKNLKIYFKSLYKKIKIELIIRIVFTILCFVGLLYQTIEIHTNYMSGNTITKINFQRNNEEYLTGISICSPFILSMENIANYNEFTKIKYKQYKHLLNLKENTNELNEINIINNNLTEIYNSVIIYFNDIIKFEN